MGAPMCGHFLDKGCDVTVYSRTPGKAETLMNRGAKWVDSPKAVAMETDVVFTMVGNPRDVQEVYFGDHGLFVGVRPSHVFVDMTTSDPALAKKIFAETQVNSAHAVDAPVSGGDVGARGATLSIMVGGDQHIVEVLRPFLSLLGQTVVHQGGAGTGQQTKLCNQIVIVGTMIGVCESLLYGFKAGLDLSSMLDSIRVGAAACWTLNNLAPRMIDRNFEPGFMVEHFIKDMGLVLNDAKRLGLVLPGLALVHQLYLAAQAHDHGHLGTHALLLALEQLSNTQINPSKM